jgi:group I intron endonuclease
MRVQKGQLATFKQNTLSTKHSEKFVIYSIRFLESQSIYIGSTTKRARKRWWDHTSQLRTKIHANKHLQNAFDKYTESSMIFEIIEISDEINLLAKEQYWLDFHNAYKEGFNRCPTAGNSFGIKRTEEQRKRQGDLDNWKKANVVWKGSKHSEESKRIIKEKRALQVMKPFSKKRSDEQSNRLKGLHASGQIKASYGNRKYGTICVEKDDVIKEFANTTEVAEHIGSWVNSVSQVLKQNKVKFKGYKIYLKTNDQVKPGELRETPEVDNPEPSLSGMI